MAMGFWTWLTGKESSVIATDRIWLTKTAKAGGLCRELFEHLANAQPSILLAHFPATLAEVQQELSRQGVPHYRVDHSISTQEVNRLGDPAGVVLLGLVKQLQPDPFSDQHAERGGLIQILVVERHFLRECDNAVMTFAERLEKRCQVTYHCSLEDPLMEVFAGEWIKEVLQRQRMDEAAPVESAMVSRRVRGAQGKFAARAGRGCDAGSAEVWLRSNGLGESP
jgi:preprotein translocase subunit SecA